jgi:hypothetical protein
MSRTEYDERIQKQIEEAEQELSRSIYNRFVLAEKNLGLKPVEKLQAFIDEPENDPS